MTTTGPTRTDYVDGAMKLPDVLPVLTLKDTVIFPYIILPLSVGREHSILAVDQALAENRIIMLVTQKDAAVESPTEDDLHHFGTAALIMRMLKLPDGRIRILVQGLSRARIEHISQIEPFMKAKIEQLDEPIQEGQDLELEAQIRTVKEGLDTVVNLGKTISPEVMIIAANLIDCEVDLALPHFLNHRCHETKDGVAAFVRAPDGVFQQSIFCKERRKLGVVTFILNTPEFLDRLLCCPAHARYSCRCCPAA